MRKRLRGSEASRILLCMRKIVSVVLIACGMHVSTPALAEEAQVVEPETERTPSIAESNVYTPKEPASVFQTVIFDNVLGASTGTSGTYFVAPVSIGMTKGDITSLDFLLDIQAKVHKFVTVGVKGSASSINYAPAYPYAQTINGITTKSAYSLLFRFGFIAQFSERIALWPNAAVGPCFDYPGTTTSTGFQGEGEVPVVFSLIRYVYLAVGPGVRGRANRTNGGFGVGLNARLGLTF